MSKIKPEIKISSIVAMAQNHVIGKDNQLIWHIPEDLKHFKRTTMGKPMIMGRKSFESLPGLLPGRPHIVVSRQSIEAQETSPNLHYTQSIPDGIKLGEKIAAELGVDEIFITGGGEIYKQTIPMIDRLYITVIHHDYDGDTVFPEFDWYEFTISHEDRREAEGDTPAFTFYTLDRK